VAKILVADDNSNIQKMVGLALKDQGIDVVAVGNGEAAVRKIFRHQAGFGSGRRVHAGAKWLRSLPVCEGRRGSRAHPGDFASRRV